MNMNMNLGSDEMNTELGKDTQLSTEPACRVPAVPHTAAYSPVKEKIDSELRIQS